MRRAKTTSRRKYSDLICRADRRRFGSRTAGKMGTLTSSDWGGDGCSSVAGMNEAERELGEQELPTVEIVDTEVGRSGGLGEVCGD